MRMGWKEVLSRSFVCPRALSFVCVLVRSSSRFFVCPPVCPSVGVVFFCADSFVRAFFPLSALFFRVSSFVAFFRVPSRLSVFFALFFCADSFVRAFFPLSALFFVFFRVPSRLSVFCVVFFALICLSARFSLCPRCSFAFLRSLRFFVRRVSSCALAFVRFFCVVLLR